MRVAGSVATRKRGLRADDLKQFFCVREAMEASGDEHTSLVLLVVATGGAGTGMRSHLSQEQWSVV